MSRRISAAIALFLVLVLTGVAVAQEPARRLSLEVRGGAAIPAFTFGAENGADTGTTLGANALYAFTPGLAGYVGYAHNSFHCDASACGADRYVDSGFGVGAELSAARGRLAHTLYPWIRGGVFLHRLERAGSEGGREFRASSDRVAGFQLRGGLAFPVTDRISIQPGASYSRYRTEFDTAALANGQPVEMNVTYVIADVALRIRL